MIDSIDMPWVAKPDESAWFLDSPAGSFRIDAQETKHGGEIYILYLNNVEFGRNVLMGSLGLPQGNDIRLTEMKDLARHWIVESMRAHAKFLKIGSHGE